MSGPGPGSALRAALRELEARTPSALLTHARPLTHEAVAQHFAARYAGVPANGLTRDEPAVLYTAVQNAGMPALLGLYGDARRVRRWLPGLPERACPAAARSVLAARRRPKIVARPACQARAEADLARLPLLRATPRDAGSYLTAGLVLAGDPLAGKAALSVHRMLALDARQLTIWMLPSRRLRALHECAVAAGKCLPVTINIGAPPAAMLASALSSAHLPAGVGKLDLAGALAGQPITLARALTQPAFALAEAEIVLEGYLDQERADECALGGEPGTSLPEFLGYDGHAQRDLPVVKVTAVTSRACPLFQAVIGPGREQSVILGLASALSAALALDETAAGLVRDLRFPAAGGGMLLLVAQVAKVSAADDRRLAALAHGLVARHPFVKLIVFVDPDVNPDSVEDVLWAVVTRANLGTDCRALPGFPALAMNPCHGPAWLAARGSEPDRTFIDATIPFALAATATRSFAPAAQAAA